MQYKIPVQVENEDKIFLNLSLRQLIILMLGFSIAYSVFKSLEKTLGGSVAIFPAGFIAALAGIIALFKSSEMTFLPFMLNLIRLQLNSGTRVWSKGVDSFGKAEIGYVQPANSMQEKIAKKSHSDIHDEILSKI